ncbi:hypothetical protein BU17DRAFT_67101 [Hysterangium stoloniferum]|nr:hypothetical protein BU17DRAFT_67101 [Hysterangium stoloniferum]
MTFVFLSQLHRLPAFQAMMVARRRSHGCKDERSNIEASMPSYMPMSGDASDNASLISDITSTSSSSLSSTIWGPGALAGKALKAVGMRALDVVGTVRMYKRLETIRKTIESEQITSGWYGLINCNRHELQKVQEDLEELQTDSYSPKVREMAHLLLHDMKCRQRLFAIYVILAREPRRLSFSGSDRRLAMEACAEIEKICSTNCPQDILLAAIRISQCMADYERKYAPSADQWSKNYNHAIKRYEANTIMSWLGGQEARSFCCSASAACMPPVLIALDEMVTQGFRVPRIITLLNKKWLGVEVALQPTSPHALQLDFPIKFPK